MRSAPVAAKGRNYQQLLGFLRIFGAGGIQKRQARAETQGGKAQQRDSTEGNEANEDWGKLSQKCRVLGNCTAEGAEKGRP
jgi:hypothetical protein